MIRLLMTLTILCASATPLAAQDEIRVLFIGNSLTFGGPQWELLEQFAAADPGGPKVVTGHHMRSATPLKWHWENSWWKSDYKTAPKAIAAEPWTHVVLQPYGDDLRHDNLKVLDKYFAAIAKIGARPILYCTTEGVMENLDKKSLEYFAKHEAKLVAAAKGSKAWIVPAKRAALLARSADPHVQLRRVKGGTDNVHPGGVGHYLIAATFYPILTGRQVVGVPFVTPGNEVQELGQAEALWLQNVAWRAILEFHGEHGIGSGFALPPAPAEELLVDTSRPEAMPEAERIARDMKRRHYRISLDIAEAERRAKRGRKPVTKQDKQIKRAFEVLRQVKRDHPDVALTPELAAIKAKLEGLPEDKK